MLEEYCEEFEDKNFRDGSEISEEIGFYILLATRESSSMVFFMTHEAHIDCSWTMSTQCGPHIGIALNIRTVKKNENENLRSHENSLRNLRSAFEPRAVSHSHSHSL